MSNGSRSLFLALLAGALVATAARPSLCAQERHALDLHRSKANFSIGHLLIGTVNGSVPLVSGSLTVDPVSHLPADVDVTLDARGIATNNGERDADLQGPDWFDTKKFPDWEFKSTQVVAGSGAAFTIEGTLTIHGIATPVRLSATLVSVAPLEYRAQTHVDRHTFKLAVNPADDLAVGSDVTIDIDAVVQ